MVTNPGSAFLNRADSLKSVQKTLQNVEAGKATQVGDILYDAEVEITNRIQRHLREMPMKMSPVSVYYCLRSDIKAILERAGESEVRAQDSAKEHGKKDTPGTDPGTHPGSQKHEDSDPDQIATDAAEAKAFKHEAHYGGFNRWRQVQRNRSQDEGFELFMKLYRNQRSSLRVGLAGMGAVFFFLSRLNSSAVT